MGLSAPIRKLQNRQHGFTLVEMLSVCAISSLLLVVLASLYRTGMWEVSRSSGRIEIVRRGRLAIDQMQRYLSSAIESSGLFSGGVAIKETVYTPNVIFDPNAPVATQPDPQDRIRFFTPIDHLGTSPKLTARQLQNAPINFAYEIVTIPGLNNEGQDIVLRRLQSPTSTTPLPIDIDVTARPQYIGRRLGFPDASAPGGYRDGLSVQRLREGALQIEVGLSSDLVTDDINRTQLEAHTPLRFVMRTIYQPPYYSLRN